MRLAIDPPSNRHSSKSKITVLDEAGGVRTTDKADLYCADERRKLVNRLVEKLSTDPEVLAQALDAQWAKTVGQQRKQEQAAKQADALPLPASIDVIQHTDMGNARRLAMARGQELRHCHPWNADLIWDGKRWGEDDTAQVERWAKDVVRDMYRQAAEETDPAGRDSLVKHALKSEEARRIHAMVSLVRSEPGIPILPADMDADPFLLNVANGTLELRTGVLRPHRREDYLTKLCPTEVDPRARCPEWLRFLNAVFERDQALIVFVQRLLGLCLTGDISEQIVPIWWGAGGNGKSTLINAVLDTLGPDYAMKANAELLTAGRGERHPTELAALFGNRLVVASETHQGRYLNEALVKDLTGGEPIRARRMHEDFWQFSPTHKVILVTNHKPKIRGRDDGIWRRLRLVPFCVRFWDPNEPEVVDKDLPPELMQDKRLGEKLARERPGILAWMVRGCLGWQREGLTLPEKVLAATAEYRGSQDLLGHWLAERCVTGRDFRQRASELYADCRQWCELSGEDSPTRDAFGEEMTARGYQRQHSNGTWYLGVALQDRDSCDGA
jgi:putative DNA primase/helicase